ncbi:ABC transporter permease [Methanospirillum purgamenti]|jgi:osmoprotectant transport system permease protein|uniref:ABC transporter permease n=1 Tax=Methanospirillum hungatei TaxID=2203 RepID=A0A8F5ZFP1_METHU|nr:ABC transporter permease [Methanospirillum hungatei]QXO95725.1 ABC transporter permease [Methanospirillum hungatei]
MIQNMFSMVSSVWTQFNLTGLTLIHLSLFGTALILILVIGLPLGIIAALSPRFSIIIQILNIIEMIPDIALLLLLIPLTGIGATPTIAAAVLYSLLPIVRNTMTGLTIIRPELLEVGSSLGMTSIEILRHIRLPLSLPLIAGGVRTAVVYSMGIVTLGGIIGARGLGAALQAGITRNNMTLILVTGLWIGLLAVFMDACAGLCERFLTNRYGDQS